ncbi:MAG: FMN-binding protein [Actinobacteria bacterium]|nr:FMN-binding protein [Actinomycetota bacterium]
MRRALLIAGGTVGGLGAVLSMTPPHLGVAAGSVTTLVSSTSTPTSKTDAPQSVSSSTTPVSSPVSAPLATSKSVSTNKSARSAVITKTATPTPTKSTASATPTPTKSTASATPTPTKSTASATPTPTKSTASATPTPAQTATPTPVAAGVSGSFTGATYDANQSGRVWGAVTVTVTLKNGEISNISATQSPSSRGYNAFNYLTPAVLTQKLSVKTVMALTPTSLVSQIRGYTGASYSSFAYWQSLQSALSKTGL